MKKNNLIIILIIMVLLLVAGGGVAFWRLKAGNEQVAEETKKKKKVLEPKNIIVSSDRPYVQLIPSADGHYLDIKILEVNKPATQVEVELEYQSGTLLQGLQDTFDINKLPVTKTKLFGSKSAGGSVTYHTDIKGGSLQLRFLGPENYVLKQDWRYINNSGETEISSKDGKFQLSSSDLKNNKKIIIYNTPGYPAGLEGESVSEIYSLTSSSRLKGEAEVSIRANEEGDLKMMAYDGTDWLELDSKVDGKTVTAETKLYELYLIVK